MILSAALLFTACGEPSKTPLTPDEPETPEQPENPDQPGGDKEDPDKPDTPDTPNPGTTSSCLVLYASRTSNTERVAQLIQKTLDCDILEVEPQTPYDSDYNSMLSRAQSELAGIGQGNYPPIKTSVENFDKYDFIFIGYPIWYAHIATPMQTFLHEHATKLAGKKIALFATSGSSGISTSVNDARSLCPSSTIVSQTLLLTSSNLSQMDSKVPEWLNSIEELKKNNETSMNIKITAGGKTITATLEDNASARDFLSRLPLDVTMNDFGDTEKIFYPKPALTTDGVSGGCTPVTGDITIYVPWGNVAIFRTNWSYSKDLIKIGHIDGDGISVLNISGDIQVKIELQQ